MIIKTNNAVEAYKMLKELKLSTIDDILMLSIWKNIKALRTIVEDYEKDIEDAKNSISDDNFKMMQERLHIAREREERVKRGEHTLTSEEYKDVQEINEYFALYSQKMEVFEREISERESDVKVVKISEEDFLKVLKANDKDFTFMENMSWMLC